MWLWTYCDGGGDGVFGELLQHLGKYGRNVGRGLESESELAVLALETENHVVLLLTRL